MSRPRASVASDLSLASHRQDDDGIRARKEKSLQLNNKNEAFTISPRVEGVWFMESRKSPETCKGR
jgi:hypothetical protein